MELHHGVLASKLCELEQQFGRLQTRIQVCQNMDLPQIQSELKAMIAESNENETLLKTRLAASRLPAMEALSEAQLEYCRKADDILRKQLLPDLCASAQRRPEGKAEAAALYAEYAIDHSIQTMRHAMVSAFTAIEAQLRAEAYDAETT